MQVPRTVERTEIQFQTGKEDKRGPFNVFLSQKCASWELQLGYFRQSPSHVTSLSGFDGGGHFDAHCMLYAMSGL